MRAAFASLTALVAFAQTASAIAVYGQCGGKNWSGTGTCDTGSVCTTVNEYYFQCLPGTATSSSSTSSRTPTPVPTTTRSTSSTTSRTSTSPSSSPTVPSNGVCSGTRTKFKYFGVNESGAEFGEKTWPGVLGTDYTWPSPSSIDYFVGKGMNSFRIPFLLERMVPPSSGLTGSFDQTYLSGLQTIVNYITSKGAYAIIEPHNYLRYTGNVITDASAFATFWTNLATVFKSNSRVIFDTINEPNGVDATEVFRVIQAAVNGIRASGATQLILVEGTSWTGAHSWISSGNADAFKALKDPLNNIAIEMHQYLDSDSSGTSGTCVSATIGAERIAAATKWLQDTGFKGFLGELGAGSNPTCISAIQNTLCAMQTAAGSPWIGFTWWAAGPWWGTYFTSIEPSAGAAISEILPKALLPFV